MWADLCGPWSCGLVNDSSPPCCLLLCRSVELRAIIRRGRFERAEEGYKKRQASTLKVPFLSSPSRNQTSSLNHQQSLHANTNLLQPPTPSTQSTWVAAVSALTPTVLAQPATATARVSLAPSHNIPPLFCLRAIWMLITTSQQHNSHDNMIFACQYSLRHRDGQWNLAGKTTTE